MEMIEAHAKNVMAYIFPYSISCLYRLPICIDLLLGLGLMIGELHRTSLVNSLLFDQSTTSPYVYILNQLAEVYIQELKRHI